MNTLTAKEDRQCITVLETESTTKEDELFMNSRFSAERNHGTSQ